MPLGQEYKPRYEKGEVILSTFDRIGTIIVYSDIKNAYLILSPDGWKLEKYHIRDYNVPKRYLGKKGWWVAANNVKGTYNELSEENKKYFDTTENL